EHRLLRAVRGFGRRSDHVGVREIRRRRVETHRLRAHRAAGRVEDAEERHRQVPVIAVRNMRICALMNVRLAWYRTDVSANAGCSVWASTVVPWSDGGVGTRYFSDSVAFGADVSI